MAGRTSIRGSQLWVQLPRPAKLVLPADRVAEVRGKQPAVQVGEAGHARCVASPRVNRRCLLLCTRRQHVRGEDALVADCTASGAGCKEMRGGEGEERRGKRMRAPSVC